MEEVFPEIFINPLEIPKIRQQILDFIPIHQLKSPRLVNHEWNQEICTILRKQSRILLNSFEDLLSLKISFSKSFKFPYQSVIFGSELINKLSEKLYQNSDFKTFCAEYSPYVKSLHLNFSTSTQVTHLLRDIIEHRFPNLESLSLLLNGGPYPDIFQDNHKGTLIAQPSFKSLTTVPTIKIFNINLPGFDKRHLDNDLQIFITSCFRKFINLETISCIVTSSKTTSNNSHRKNQLVNESFSHLNRNLSKSILQSILCISCNGNKVDKDKLRCLSHLKILLKVTNDELKTLGNGHFLLETCYLELDFTVEASTLIHFLMTHKDSLKTLHIEFQEKSSISIELTFLIPYLKKISLSKYSGLLDFLKKCPSVEDVRIENLPRNTDRNFYFNDNTEKGLSLCSDSLRSFKLHHNYKEFGDEKLPKSLSDWFPNLTGLELHNTNDYVLRGVFKNLRHLRNVLFTGKDITDIGICGDTSNILKIFMNSMMRPDDSFQDYGCASLSQLSQVLEFKPTFPCIGDLTNLQSCKIDCNLISDAAIIFGLLCCKRLKQLYLFSSFELITSLGVSRLSELEDLVELNVFVRNIGWISQLRR